MANRMSFSSATAEAADILGGLTCQVCGDQALSEDSPHEFAIGLVARMICQTCGAHQTGHR